MPRIESTTKRDLIVSNKISTIHRRPSVRDFLFWFITAVFMALLLVFWIHTKEGKKPYS
jgi:succinate dehydrogenase hydrophobic anchor subunit